VVNLTITKWRFKKDQRVHHGECSKKDVELLNTRAVGPNLSFSTFEELQSQVTSWGLSIWRNFEEAKANKDCYNMHSYM
jgi:hypothetical protein